MVPESSRCNSPLRTGVFRDLKARGSAELDKHSFSAPPESPRLWLLMGRPEPLGAYRLRSLCPGSGTGGHLPPVSSLKSELRAQPVAWSLVMCVSLCICVCVYICLSVCVYQSVYLCVCVCLWCVCGLCVLTHSLGDLTFKWASLMCLAFWLHGTTVGVIVSQQVPSCGMMRQKPEGPTCQPFFHSNFLW